MEFRSLGIVPRSLTCWFCMAVMLAGCDGSHDETVGEMKHADQIIERILFLEGIPNLSAYDKILIGSGVKQQLENDRDLEMAALTVLHPGIKTCMEANDDSTRELLEHIVIDEEKHIDWIEAQLHQIKEVGYENYLAQQIHKKD